MVSEKKKKKQVKDGGKFVIPVDFSTAEDGKGGGGGELLDHLWNTLWISK